MSDDNESLYCPITQEIFRDPVIAEDGRLYEREAITRWINENGTSPFTRQTLNVNYLQPDEQIRKKADRVKLPPIQPPPTIHVDDTITDRRSTDEPRVCGDKSFYERCVLSIPWIICGISMICGVVLPISIAFSSAKSSRTSTSTFNKNHSGLCYPLNHTLTKTACLASFTKITYIQSSTCHDFAYRHFEHTFVALSSRTTIIFAFQQTFGYWDIDNITLCRYNSNQNVFQSGGFESGSLSPGYNRCQSAGFISNSSQINGRYCYSDRTKGKFGYLMQSVLTTVGSWYSLEFHLQNRNGSGSSFVVLLGI